MTFLVVNQSLREKYDRHEDEAVQSCFQHSEVIDHSIIS